MAATTRLFLTNGTRAVRLPEDVAFPDSVDEVEIMVVGQARLLVPKGQRRVSYVADGPFAEAGFMAERDQPEPQEREAL